MVTKTVIKEDVETMKKSFLILVTAIMFVLAGCGSKPTLFEWVNGKDIAEVESTANATYASANITVDISADGEDILVYTMVYDKDAYATLGDMEQDAIDEYFNSQIETLKGGMLPMFDACKQELDIELKAVRVEYVWDGKVLWSYDITK